MVARLSFDSGAHNILFYGLSSQLPSSTALALLPQEEVESLLTKAGDCADGECSIDEVADLLNVLKSQQKELQNRVEELKKTIESLEKVNQKDSRQVDEVRETVRAIYRIFQLGDKASGNDYPKLSKPTGWSGEVGDGPKTAYDALPPKPYKK